MAGQRTLPGVGLTGFWDLGTNYKPDMDSNLLRLSFLVQPYVLDSVADDPVAPADGDIYRATGNWTSTAAAAGQIAVRDNGAWVAFAPVEGWTFFDRANGQTIRYNGAAWVEWQGGAFTAADKAKLDAIVGTKFLGTYATLTALQTAHPAPAEGSYGHVDPGPGQDVLVYIWDNDDSAYIQTQSNLTGAQIVALIDAELGGTTWQSGGGGGGTAVAFKVKARYWRMAGMEQASGTGRAMAEVVVKQGGSALAISAVTALTTFSGYPASNAVDANAATYWSSNGLVYNEYFRFDFGTVVAPDEIIITARNDANFTQAPQRFRMEYSYDDVTWFHYGTTAETVTAYTTGSSKTFNLSNLNPFSNTVQLPDLAGNAGKAIIVNPTEDGLLCGVPALSLSSEAASRNLSDADFVGNKVLLSSAAGAITFTIPSGLIGTEPVTIVQNGAGQVTIAAGVGATLNSADGKAKSRVQYSSMTLIPVATNTYLLMGDLTA